MITETLTNQPVTDFHFMTYPVKTNTGNYRCTRHNTDELSLIIRYILEFKIQIFKLQASRFTQEPLRMT